MFLFIYKFYQLLIYNFVALNLYLILITEQFIGRFNSSISFDSFTIFIFFLKLFIFFIIFLYKCLLSSPDFF